MASIIGDLAVRIGANTEDLQAGLGKARKGLKDVASEARSGASDFVKYSAAAAAAGAAVTAALVVASAQAAKEIKNLAAVGNVGTNTFQKLAFGAKSVDIEVEKLSDILKDFNDRVGDFNATGGGPMADFFEKIAPRVGITAEAFKNLSGDQALQLYVNSLEKANLSQADFTFYMETMASDSTALLPLLRNNGAAMAEQAKRAEELGLALSDIDVQNLATLNNRIDDAKDIFSSLTQEISAKLAPAINVVMKEFEGVIKEAGGVGEIASKSFNTMIDAAAFAADAVDGVNRVTMLAGSSALSLGNSLGMLWSGLASTIINGPVHVVNTLIEAFNGLSSFLGTTKLPTVSLSEWGRAANATFDAHASQIEERNKVMLAILDEPLAGTAFKKYIAEAQSAAQAAAGAVVAGKKTEGENLSEWNAIIDDELKAQRDKQIQDTMDFEAMISSVVSDARDGRLQDLAADHKRQQDLDAANYAARKAALGTMLDNLSTLMAGKSRKMFEVGKVAASANAVVSSIEGAQKAYTALAGIPIIGPGLGIAAAGAAMAAGAIRVQAINKQSFSKGTVPGAAAGQTAQNIGNQVAGGGGGGPAPVQYIQGINPGDLFTGSQMMDVLNRAYENGARPIFI